MKNNKPVYYIKRHLSLLVPNFIYRLRRRYLLDKFEKMSPSQREYILDRVNYYCKLDHVEEGFAQRSDVKPLSTHKLSSKKDRKRTARVKSKNRAGHFASVYFFDTYEYIRSLPQSLKWAHYFGDVYYLLPLPAVTKSRPIGDDNQNSVILKLNKLRHFIYVKDPKSFEQKEKIAIFRGNIRGKQRRIDFVSKFHNHPLFDVGDVSKHPEMPSEWQKDKKTLPEQLQYKFIIALEGNDVASNLKWVMSSNSVAVMPRPTCETWFMEGRLIPNVHYIEIADDYSDMEERIQYYLDHPSEAEEIIKNAHDHWSQFLDREREDIISHLVLKKYFTQTGQCVDD